jgi:uncharacterized repeat protein (TIGR01451 family)
MAGQTAVYTLTVTNHGPALAGSVILSHSLPSGTTLAWFTPRQNACHLDGTAGGTIFCDVGDFLGGDSVTVTLDARAAGSGVFYVDPPAPSCVPSQDGRTLTCHLGDLASGAQAQVHLAATVSASITGSVINRAVVAAINPDLDPSNNTVAVALIVAPGVVPTTGTHAGSDLAVWTDAPPVVIAGKPFTYTLTVANNGPLGATGVTLHDILPPGLLVHSTAPGRPTCAFSENAFTCRLDDPESNQDITFTFVVLSDITAFPNIELDPLDPGWPLCEVEGTNALSRAVHCHLGDLASGQKTRVTLLVTAGALMTRTITNTVSVRANESDADLQNNAHRRAITVGLEAGPDPGNNTAHENVPPGLGTDD